MKKLVFLIGILVMTVGLAKAQEETVKDNGNGPEIEFEKLVHDYGQIYQGENGECEFVFKNTGKAELVLTNCRSSCGCTVPSWPKDPIAPGKKAVIKVKYNTQRIGQINKTITVESNAVNDRVVLKITGNVNPKPSEAAPENNNGAPKADN